jgi:hypothetical protein
MNYITRRDLVENNWGAKREEHVENQLAKDNKTLRLPFYYCNLSLKESNEPYCAIEKTDPKNPGNIGKFL